MNKSELQAALNKIKAPFREAWTVPELRSIVLEYGETDGKKTTLGVPHMRMEELIEKCKKDEITLSLVHHRCRALRGSIPSCPLRSHHRRWPRV